MGNLDWAIPAPLEKERGPADSRITQRRSSRPSTALLPWSPWTGTGGRHRLEMVVVINRKPRSPWPGARTLNKDFYQNLKAQAWWQLRRRFEKTHRCVSDLTGQTRYDQDELISIPSNLPLLRTLQKELSQPTASKGTRLRMVIDKQPEGTRSPNLADAIVMAYWPVGDGLYESMSWV
jgi:hypothetical protein